MAIAGLKLFNGINDVEELIAEKFELLLGDNLSSYAQKVDLCIDHHGSNTFFAKNTFLEEFIEIVKNLNYEQGERLFGQETIKLKLEIL